MVQRRLSRQESRQQTRERLLEAATKVFSKRGFYEASLDEVAEEAGFSKGAVYSNFANKEGLFMALLDRHLKVELQNVTSQFTQEGKEGESTLRRSFATHLEEQRTWNMLSIEFSLYAMRHPVVQQQLAERYRLGREALATTVRETQQAKQDISKLSPEYIAWALLALGNGLALQAYLEPGVMPTDLYSTLVEQLFR